MRKYVTKRCLALLFAAVLGIFALSGCGGGGKTEGKRLDGSCEEILGKVYENAELDAELREAMKDYVMTEIPAESAEYMLGTTGIAYTDSVCSAPQINAVAYQCILLRMEEGADIEAAKKQIADNADPAKWVCVEAESVIVESREDLILFVMTDADVAEAIRTAFLNL